MAVANTSVFAKQTKRTILPWTIIWLPEESHTIADFFSEAIKPRIAHECQLISACVGPAKVSLDPVDVSLQILPVLNLFGRFVKYNADISNGSNLLDDTLCHNNDPFISDSAHKGPEFVTPINARNRKDKLFNDLISLFVSHNALFEKDEVVPLGKELVLAIRNILWYIYGYHSVLAERALPIPSLFQSFKGYNVP